MQIVTTQTIESYMRRTGICSDLAFEAATLRKPNRRETYDVQCLGIQVAGIGFVGATVTFAAVINDRLG